MNSDQIKLKNNFGFYCLLASAFFLFNPDIAIIDFIPDVFGYILMIVGLGRLSLLNEKIYDAREGFKKAAICNAVKFGLIVVLFGLVSPKEMPVSMLLFTFVMNIFDLIYVVPAYINLFGGLTYLGERLDGSYILGRKRFIPRKVPENLNDEEIKRFENKERKRKLRFERKLSNTEKFQRGTIFFVIFKAVAPILPESTALLNHDFNNFGVNFYDFIYLFRTMSIMLTFVIGIIWLVKTVRYYAGVRGDNEFIFAVKNKYISDVLPNKVYFAKKTAKNISAILICASFLCLNLYFDEYNIIPGVISAVLFAVGALKMRPYSSKWKLCFCGSLLMGVGSVALEISRFKFNFDFIKEQIMKNPAAYEAWEKMFNISLFAGVAVAFTLISAIFLVRDAAKKYSGFFVAGTDSFDPERATKELHSELCRPLIVTGVFAVLFAACIPLYFFAMPIRFEAVWFFDLVLGLIFAFCFAQNISDVTRNINYSHFTENE